MSGTSMTAALRQVSRLLREGTLGTLPDDRLLDRFLDQGDEDAFASLVARHGPMVLGVCLDVLRDPIDAEDAFQATFVTLVRRARSIRGRECVGGWLRRVAHRSALAANAGRLRHRQQERFAARAGSSSGTGVADGLDRSELKQAIGDEIGRLPEPYRRPVVLCLLEGLPQPEAARCLRISEGAIRGRLARARALLRDRLARRGVAPGGPARYDAPTVPAAWIGSILAAARAFKAGRSASIGWAGASVKITAALVVLAGLLSLAAGSPKTPPTAPEPPSGRSPSLRPQATAAAPPVVAEPAKDSGRTIVLRGKILDPEGHPVAGAQISLVADAWARPVEQGISGADGSYHLALPEATFRHNFDGGLASPRVQVALIATADGLGPAWVDLQADTQDGKNAMKPEYAHDLHLVADRPIEGQVVDTEGKPVFGAIVAVSGLRAVTDGRWEPILAALKALDTSPLFSAASHPNNWSYPMNRSAWDVIPPATTDEGGHFHLAGVGRDRRIDLRVTGPGIRPAELSVMTVDNVAGIARALREKYPRKRGPDGFFYTNYNTPREVPHAVMIFDASPTIEVERGQTVGGVVRDARTGEPIPRMRLAITSRSGGSDQINTDERGRYRGARQDHESTIWVHAMSDAPDRYLSAVREFHDATGPGEIVADFAIEPGVMVEGRVFEAGTDRPIVSSPRDDCHVQGHVVAGRVEYFPLSTNAALRATPTGLYFAGPPLGQNRRTSTWIEGDGRFRMVVPPGPGVLLIKAEPGLPMMSQLHDVWKESEGFHRLFPYARLTAREKKDGAPGDDPKSFPGFSGPIPVASYHAYKMINPPADAETFPVELTIPRAPSQLLRFVGPDGLPVRGVTVAGLLPLPLPMISLDGSEAEALALDPSSPRPLLALSHDGLFFARDVLGVTGAPPMPPRTITFEPASSISGRLLDAATGRPLSGFTAWISYPGDDDRHIPRVASSPTTDAEGRYLIRGLIPDLRLSVTYRRPPRPGIFMDASPDFRPVSLQNLTLRAREARHVGELRISIREKPSG